MEVGTGTLLLWDLRAPGAGGKEEPAGRVVPGSQLPQAVPTSNAGRHRGAHGGPDNGTDSVVAGFDLISRFLCNSSLAVGLLFFRIKPAALCSGAQLFGPRFPGEAPAAQSSLLRRGVRGRTVNHALLLSS